MSVSPQDVKRLREKTGAGMGDCKSALVEAEGDFEAAQKILKKQGLASAAKRRDRQTSEGAVFFAQDAARLIMMEIRCETDFVAMNEEFRKLGQAVAQQALEENLSSANEALITKVQEGVLALKENLNIGCIANIPIAPGDTIVTYSHNNGAIGTAVVLHSTGISPEAQKLKQLGRDLAMHAAAYQPSFLDSSKVDAQVIAEQLEIFCERAERDKIPEKARKAYLQGQQKKMAGRMLFCRSRICKRAQEYCGQNFCKIFLSKMGPL